MKRKKATMSDVAALAGVSQTTVSLILNKKVLTSFPQSTVDSVMSAVRQLDYRIKSGDKRANESNVILVFAVKMSNPYYSVMLQSIEYLASINHYQVLTCNTYHNEECEGEYLEMAIRNSFAGVIFLYPPDNTEAFRAASALIPIISICDRTSSLNTDIVELDNYRSGQLAAEHLVSLGHKTFTFFTYHPDGNSGRMARIDGMLSVLKQYGYDKELTICSQGVDMDEMLSDNHYDYHYGFALANNPAHKTKSTAIICVNDMLAFGVMDALLEQGLRIPEDVSVIGFDNLLFTRFSRISLTTIDHHMGMVARYAIEMLLQKIRMQPRVNEGEEIYARFRVECQPSLIVRGSTGPWNG